MDKVIINRWNQTVSEKDTVYHLGDFFLTYTEKQMEIMDKLNGNIILIRGNHDRQTDTKLIKRLGFKKAYDKLVLEDRYILTHRPIEEVEKGYINIHGHTHSQRENDDKHFCVSVENTGYRPIPFERIKNNIDKINPLK